MNPTKKMPLFIVTGASGVGKSAICEVLFQNEKDYIVLESDLLWDDRFNTPEDDYRAYRELWLRLCRNIAQIGTPVVLCGCGVPKQFESCDERKYFSNIYYLAVVCEEAVLEKRLREGRSITDEAWIRSSKEFNAWLKVNADKSNPSISLLDTSMRNQKEAAKLADQWIRDILKS